MNIAFIGVGNVGSALADNLATRGHRVAIAARDPNSETVKSAQAKNSDLLVKPVAEAVSAADVVDTGPLAMSLHLEHMTLLWIKVARVQKVGAGFTWAALRR